MTGIGPLVAVIAAIGFICFLALLARMWAIGGKGEASIGPRHAPHPIAPPGAAVPSEFRLLIAGEAVHWKPSTEWQAVIHRLDELAEILGAGPAESEAPSKYSASWLEQRVAQVEAVVGGPARSQPPVMTEPTKNLSTA